MLWKRKNEWLRYLTMPTHPPASHNLWRRNNLIFTCNADGAFASQCAFSHHFFQNYQANFFLSFLISLPFSIFIVPSWLVVVMLTILHSLYRLFPSWLSSIFSNFITELYFLSFQLFGPPPLSESMFRYKNKIYATPGSPYILNLYPADLLSEFSKRKCILAK